MMIWYEQNMFFRRFALDDKLIIFLNGFLIFIVLFYVYPLKFLFSLMFSAVGNKMQIEQTQVPSLMYIYSAGYIIIYLLFFFMYVYACRKKDELELTPKELYDTKTSMWAQMILAVIGVFCIIATTLLPAERAGMAGFIYFLIGPVFSIYFSVRSKNKRRFFDQPAV
jgi:predicted histidine transporter YuiF (NhaC family)